jgi:hypothetical protein
MIRLLLLLGGLAGGVTGSLLARLGADVVNVLFLVALGGFGLAFLWILWVRANPPPVYGLGAPPPPDSPAPLPKVQVISYRGNDQATMLWGELLLPADGAG